MLPARRDDDYFWSDVEARDELRIHARGIEMRDGIDWRQRTGLLRVELRPTLMGRCFEPWIEIRAGGSAARQFFECGARGAHMLNLSPLLQAEAGIRRVALRARGLRLAPSATLLRFAPLELEGKHLLVLAPHPDDAELAAFGLYSRHDAMVVTVTAGDRLPRADLRVSESLEVPRLGAIPAERAVNLAYPDGKLAAMHAQPEREFHLECEPGLTRASLRARNAGAFADAAAGCRWVDLVAELRVLLASWRPDFIVTPHPRLDAHPDHVHVTRALDEALHEGPAGARLLLYTVHVARAPRFPVGPDDGIVSMPPGGCEGVVGAGACSVTLDTRTIERKRAALMAMSAVRANPSLLRRGCRPNEFFQLADVATLRAMLGAGACNR